MLEQIAYEVPRSLRRKQIIYRVKDLESLSATALYYGDGSSSGSSSGSGGGFGGFGGIDEKDRKKFGIVRTPLIKSTGTSNFLTSLRIDNLAKLHPMDQGQGIPISPNSFGYFNATGKPLGTLEQLNCEEMSTLLTKYSKK